MERSTILQRFKYASNNDKFTMDEELGMIKHIVAKYNFISKSEYARKESISPQGVDARLKSNNEPYIKMIGKLFIIK
tara:strand:+ start:156 stop:386 length:231 start_codon:yes stop_codon:yes gene_type:complete